VIDPLITYRRKPATLDTAGLELFAETLRTRVARGREFHCRIANDAELQALNARFRARDYPTDVLSFPAERLLQGHGHKAPAGDIAISLQRARAQSRAWNHTVEDEIRILMLHGLLHLLGMDHESDSGQMQRAERRWRRAFGLPTSLIERAA
jgi:probable rRNA maturation factor